MTPVALTLLGLGVGVLLVASGRSPRSSMTLRDRALEAQRISALASQRARELAAQWSAEQDKIK